MDLGLTRRYCKNGWNFVLLEFRSSTCKYSVGELFPSQNPEFSLLVPFLELFPNIPEYSGFDHHKGGRVMWENNLTISNICQYCFTNRLKSGEPSHNTNEKFPA